MTAIEDARAALAKLIDEAKYWLDRIEGEWGRGKSYDALLAEGDEDALVIAGAAAALDALIAEHERLTTPPTDDEREALARTVYYWDVSEDVGSQAWEQLTENQRDVWREAADAILAAGFRRQGPITDTPPATAEVVDERHPECVKAWPECESFGYDPRCCRYPKSCSAGIIRRVEAAERAR